MFQKILIYGSLAGLIMVGFFMAAFGSGAESSLSYSEAELLGYAGIILAMTMILVAMFHYRRNMGNLQFIDGLKLGIGISVVAGLIFGVFTILLYEFIMPDLGRQLLQKSMEEAGQLEGMTPEKMEAMQQ